MGGIFGLTELLLWSVLLWMCQGWAGNQNQMQCSGYGGHCISSPGWSGTLQFLALVVWVVWGLSAVLQRGCCSSPWVRTGKCYHVANCRGGDLQSLRLVVVVGKWWEMGLKRALPGLLMSCCLWGTVERFKCKGNGTAWLEDLKIWWLLGTAMAGI